MPYTLHPASPTDLPILAPLSFQSFANSQGWTAMFGPNAPRSHSLTQTRWLGSWSDQSDIWIKDVDSESGEIVGAANWRLRLKWDEGCGRREVEKVREVGVEWWDGGDGDVVGETEGVEVVEERKEIVRGFLREWMGRRERFIKGPNLRELESIISSRSVVLSRSINWSVGHYWLLGRCFTRYGG